MKKTIIAIIAVVIVGLGIYYFINNSDKEAVITTDQKMSTTTPTTESLATTTLSRSEIVIGQSVEGKNITAYNFGNGEKSVLFIGGVHGGYAWNTALLGYQLVDYLKANPNIIPTGEKVTVIPVLNPDGLKKTVGTDGRFDVSDVPSSVELTVPGRYNANNVDLNRNFDCDWQKSGVWKNLTVSGGSQAFSEPESATLKNYIESNKPSAVVVWYSAAGGVFSSNCHNGILTETVALTNAYAQASGYPAHEEYDYYETTGDLTNWLAKVKIPAISVLLTNHSDTEWSKNIAGVKAVLNYFAE